MWISSYQPSVGPAGANTVPSGRGGALIKADPTTANAVYTSYPAADYSSPVFHTVCTPLRPWLFVSAFSLVTIREPWTLLRPLTISQGGAQTASTSQL